MLGGLVLVLGLATWLYVANQKTIQVVDSENTQLNTVANNSAASPNPPAGVVSYKTFTANEFKQLYLSVGYPNTQLIAEAPEITGNVAADERIRTIAEKRGYKLKSIPVASIAKTEEVGLEGDDLLQPLALQAWQELKTSAKAAGMPLRLTSAYRNPAYQRDLFVQRLLAKGASVARIAAGENDGAVEGTLLVTAPPGYSRHHTGYTIDMWCDDGSTQFIASRCFAWLKTDNYLNAKKFGWIPSYPEGADLQGPEPEPWEYVWVGKNALIKQ